MLARGEDPLRNIPLIEDDRYHDLALDTSAYEFRDGQWFIPEKPGWGVELSPDYEEFSRMAKEIVIALVRSTVDPI